ncbi:MAG: hypothetical protein JW814_04335 [Candidatus Krumholzibacteriota bacterium]|nr:hypothetical protein [Candidatus Krumholzibacteriota bacterium]
MARRTVTAIICVFLCSALCDNIFANSLENISNPVLREYSAERLQEGAPSLETASRVIYSEAVRQLDAGNYEKAKGLLILSGSVSGSNPDPFFTLARVELLRGSPDFLFHLIEGFKHQAWSLRNQGLLALNLAIHLAASALIALALTLVIMIFKYWQFINHKTQEAYSKKYSFPPSKYIGILIIISLLVMRLGAAIYIAILISTLWMFMTRREKTAVTFLVIVTGIISVTAPLSNMAIPAIDRNSITGRLALLNESGGNQGLIDSIDKIEGARFEGAKEFALGTLMYRIGRYEEARTHLLASVSADGSFAPAYLNLGNVYFMQADYNKALAGYQNVLAIDSTNAVAHFNIGQAYINKMLFAESSRALKQASSHGIEKFRDYHPSTRLRDLSVYDQSFPNRYLWSMAKDEAALYDTPLIGELFRPWLLFPFRWLGYLLGGSIFLGIFISGRISGDWKVFRCANCSTATCPSCSNQDTGLSLCGDCTNLINGLSSVKVMEALLRHRRQKIGPSGGSKAGWKVMIIPGAARIWYGRTGSGICHMIVDSAAILTLVWSGFYFKDPRVLIAPSPVIRIALPVIILTLSYLTTLRIRPVQDQKNFKILPPEFLPEEKQESKKNAMAEDTVEEKTGAGRENFEAFLDSL